MYVDAVYCYRLSVCRSVTVVSPAKTAETVVMPFGLRTRVGPRNHALHGVQILPWGKGRPIVTYTDTLRSPVRKRMNDRDAVWTVSSDWPKKS